jgi:hypothetical protein
MMETVQDRLFWVFGAVAVGFLAAPFIAWAACCFAERRFSFDFWKDLFTDPISYIGRK